MDMEHHQRGDKPFEQKLKCTIGCNIIHLLQLLRKQLGFWQPFVDKDPVPPWHQITVASKDSLNKVLRLQPLGSMHIYTATGFGSGPAMNLCYNTRKAHSQNSNLAVTNTEDLMKKILVNGLTQLLIYRKFFFRKIQNGEIWISNSKNVSVGHCVTSPSSRITSVFEQCIRGQEEDMRLTPTWRNQTHPILLHKFQAVIMNCFLTHTAQVWKKRLFFLGAMDCYWIVVVLSRG